MMREGSSPSVHSCTFLHDGWLDFLNIGYHDQVPCAAAASNIEFGCVPKLSNYGNFFSIKFQCCDISEKNVIFFFIFVTVIRYNALLMLAKIVFDFLPNLST